MNFLRNILMLACVMSAISQSADAGTLRVSSTQTGIREFYIDETAVFRHVPDPFTTIQEAVMYAETGDTVLVADGTYSGLGNRNIDFLGKAITIQSENGPETCIIDCEHLGRGFLIRNGEGEDSIVDGFTIRNANEDPLVALGGAIHSHNTAPTIRHCIITSNTARRGGGIWGYDSSIKIHDCIITDNYSLEDGGGIFLRYDGSPEIINCTIQRNYAEYDGGGVFSQQSAVTIANCVISGNSCGYSGGGFNSQWATTIHRNNIYENNIAMQNGGGIGMSGGQIDLINCLINSNQSMTAGGGIGCLSDVSANFLNCSIFGNTSIEPGGGIRLESGTLNVMNCILWGDTSGEIIADGAISNVSHSDIQGGFSGTETIDIDPLFISGPAGAFYLSQIDAGDNQDSPCINRGHDTSAAICFDLPEQFICLDQLTTRHDGMPDSGIADMGFHYRVSEAEPTPEPCIHSGDANGDGVLSSEDCQMAFIIVLGSYQATDIEYCAADCNGSGRVTSSDAQSIFAAAFGIGGCQDLIE